jgi:hypothetical protein
MLWFRSHLRSCAAAALFALAVQGVLAFGHIHRDDLGLPPLPAAGHAQIATHATPAPGGPANPDQSPAPDDYCAICASMAQIATAMPALPPLLIAPAPIEPIWPEAPAARTVATNFALSFQARAPPIA